MVQTGQHYTLPGSGVFIASGVLTPGGHADIIVGSSIQTATNATSYLEVIDGVTGTVVTSLTATTQSVFSNSTLNEGVRVAVRDVNWDGIPDIEVATGAGPTQQVRFFDLSGASLVLEDTLNPSQLGLPANYTSGMYIG
jgi:hypothetical protein